MMMVIMFACARYIGFVLEQPANSLMTAHPRVQQLIAPHEARDSPGQVHAAHRSLGRGLRGREVRGLGLCGHPLDRPGG